MCDPPAVKSIGFDRIYQQNSLFFRNTCPVVSVQADNTRGDEYAQEEKPKKKK